mmetsp:Transcript_10419/g.18152  ORF Transcript_10419/g.18152 Transcript_10419/m.18152 type:complete len:338 (+) Transcript_10419:32-1045(+)
MFPGMPPGGMPGMPGGPGGSFDFSTLQAALNDPAIKEMAEQIASDPTFKQITEQLQGQFGGMFAQGAPGAPGAPGATKDGDPAAAAAAIDPSNYMQAMAGMFQNQNFMKMAEQLGKTIIEKDPHMSSMMTQMQEPEYRSKIEDAMKNMKGDPELKSMMDELESQGPMAMMKYWNDPEMLAKLGSRMGNVFDVPGAEGVAGALGEEEEAEGEEEVNLHSAASAGDAEQVKGLLASGSSPDEVDEEGRTALHFAAGYGELDCVRALIGAKAKLDAVDNNKNTPLHYAAGYGEGPACKLLLESGADKDAKNADGKTAQEVAELNEKEEVVKVFKEPTIAE